MNAPTPGWHPDPSGRHEHRYWDGVSWTDDVADDAVTSVDPVAEAAAPTPTDPAPTAPLDPTRAYDPQPTGWPPQPPGPPPPGAGGPPPATPPKGGPPTGLVVALAVIVALLVGLAVVLTRGDGDDETAGEEGDAAEDTTTDGTTTDGTASTSTEAPTTTAGTGADPRTANVFALRVGDCVTDDAEVASEVRSVTIVDCDVPHALEVFHRHDIAGTSLPDGTGIETVVRERCLPAFEQFVGLDFDSSSLEVHYFSPTGESWDAGDRALLCLVADPAGQVTGSLEGADR